ncbi:MULTISPECIES: branched-chain amino acid ABC transporter substrate-binding protein [unclassified Chelatococcus]|uniref:branched-chain amino acid ABC transporter substrate-binding protein n=1 Tax=unclassified Chelatococcus TaxID=2638111 RepID=UPI001BD1699C|nr:MULTISPECIES: branched-chain amino acid ABC transporter substrate-binding protein [unclassified Chelatococcus]MBS7701371.1 branched-chain amino acid ABC transporter substrate-binding protein [Chelatococcus sp. YT9]MBX3557451.1 branched-chain amino acid ABC transporter substrate-binding protein [Chelatococcus sp.]
MRTLLTMAAAVSMFAGSAAADVKVAYLDTLSGPFGAIGENGLTTFQLVAEQINAAGGIKGEKLEIKAYDNGGTPEGTLLQMQKAIDGGARFVMIANGSALAAALVDGVNKYNARNPGNEVLYLNWGASAPELTNENCSFWHFRFAPHSGMAVNALTDFVKNRTDIKKVYLIGQDYVFGRSVLEAAVEQLKVKRPDVEIVGKEYHPVGKVKDFTPYVQKIITSGADAVLTGNWGQDMVLLVKAAADSGAKMPFLTVFGGSRGTIAALGQAAVGKLLFVNEGNNNMDVPKDQSDLVAEYKKRFPEYDYLYHRNRTTLEMLKLAIEKAGSSKALPVAKALEGLTYNDPYGPVTMRASDHQLQLNQYVSVVAEGVKVTSDGTPYGWKLVEGGEVPMAAGEMETTCKMKRPN